jgi:hypothetical protein
VSQAGRGRAEVRIDLKRGGILLVFFLAGLMLIWLGLTGRFGLFLGAIFTPEYLTVEQ